jgi:hypothetical protein
MLDGFAAQMDAQLGRKLFTYNNFGKIRRPHLKARPIEKIVSLGELASILGPLKNTMPLGDDDFKAIRQKTGFMPETLPDLTSEPEAAAAPVETPPAEAQPDNDEPIDPAEAVQASMAQYRAWTRDNDPAAYALLSREVVE